MIGWLMAGCAVAGMARKLRVEYPGAIHPVVNRGDRREPILRDDFDRERLAETRVTAGWIAERLRMGSVASVNTLPDHWQRDRRK